MNASRSKPLLNWIGRVAPFLAVAVGLGLLYHPTLSSLFRSMQNDLGDTRLVLYVLEHSYRWIGGDPAHGSFWNPPFFFPAVNTAAYSETLLGAAPFYWVFRVVGAAPDTSLQLWMILMSTLNFAAARYWLRRGLGLGRLAATAGAFLFAFAGPRGAQASHPQLLPQFYSILALHALTRLLQAPRDPRARLWIAGFASAYCLQIFASVYLGWMLGFGLALALVTALFFIPARRSVLELLTSQSRAWAVAASASLIVLLPLATHYLEAAGQIGYRRYEDVLPPRIQSWLYLGSGTWLYGWQDRIKGFRMLSFEQRMGIGWATLAMAGLGLKEIRRNSWGRVLALAAVGLVVLTSELYPGVTAWRALYFVVPGAKAIRALSRISLLFLIPASIGVAFFLERRRKVVVAIALSLLLVLEQVQATSSYDKLWARERAARVAALVRKGCASFFLTSDETPDYVPQLDAMLASLEVGIPTLNGYSGANPPGWKGSTTQAWLASYGLPSSGLCVVSGKSFR